MSIVVENVSERTYWLMYKLDKSVHWSGYVDSVNELTSGLDRMKLFQTKEELAEEIKELNFPN